ncbi:MAG: efflux RND transporter periplasmic adaptor subunit [Gemmatimonadetes bacterium]|nr:efflux RND transporter periplasmic adaptor subunit [Gemmatimonadota bacterium]
MKTRTQIALATLLVLAAAALVGWQLQGEAPAQATDAMEGHDHSAMAAGADTQSPVRLSPDDARRIGVTFATAELRSLEVVVEALGAVGYDETRLAAVNPKIEGWIEELHVDFTGATVAEGHPLMDVYSPMLVSAQEELSLAARLLRDAPAGRAEETARTLLESARRRLSYWDVPDDEIARIEESGTVSRTLTLRAPAGGIVVEKNVVQGDRIVPGMTLFRVADLSRVWIEADVFEKDLALVAEGQRAVATFEALPGRTFEARVTYVYPTVSMESRTGRVRLELRNPRGELKPGMYARVRLDAPARTPEVVVPRAAVLSTGTRSLVFVRAADGELVPREVVAGRSAGAHVAILEGLSAGDRVVASAAFLVDAESSLGALTAGMDAMESSGDDAPVDHSEHDMGAMPPDTTPAVDHSGHDMGAMPPDTSGTSAPRR